MRVVSYGIYIIHRMLFVCVHDDSDSDDEEDTSDHYGARCRCFNPLREFKNMTRKST